MNNLKLCPFCGKPGCEMVDNGGDYPSYSFGCGHCFFDGLTLDEWQTRPLEDELESTAERLRVELFNTDKSCAEAGILIAELQAEITRLRAALKGIVDYYDFYEEYNDARKMAREALNGGTP